MARATVTTRPNVAARVAAAIVASAFGLPSCSGGRAAPPDIVVVLLDTLRVDALGCYGSPLPTSPWLDALASEGTVFERAVAMSPWTQPSMVALFTGRSPSRFFEPTSQRESLGRGLPPGEPSLAERLQEAGYHTAAVVDSPWLRRDNGMARGFDTFDEVWRRPSQTTEVPARGRPGLPTEWPIGGAPFARVVGAVRNVLATGLSEDPDRPPLFLYLHLLYAHAPYAPPPEFRGTLRRAATEAGITDAAHVAYLEEVRALDARLEELLDPILRGPRTRSLVLHVLSDHGESFGERGERDHGTNLHQELVHVPWIVWSGDARGSGGAARRRGVRVEDIVHHLDLVPTLLETAGIPPEPELPGRSLVGLLRGAEPPEPLPGISEFPLLPGRLRRVSLQDERWKVVASPHGTIAAYDLRTDPDERVNRLDDAGRPPEEARPLEARARDWIESRPDGRIGGAELPDPEVEEALRGLGYGGG